MQNYELTLVLEGKATAAKKNSVSTRIEKLVEAVGGKVGKLEDMGQKDLSYKIGKTSTGVFLFYPLQLTADSPKKINDKLRLDEDVIRFLLIKD